MNITEWNTSDIEGSIVYEKSGERLGELVGVLPTGYNDVWVVRPDPGPTGEAREELLVPALKEVVLEVDVQAKRITVALPPGLREIFEELDAQRRERQRKLELKKQRQSRKGR